MIILVWFVKRMRGSSLRRDCRVFFLMLSGIFKMFGLKMCISVGSIK